jgi:nucleotide-binding universal stress UspA family protein
MTFVVPFDGSEQSLVGVRRAVEVAPPSIRVVAFSVVPRKHSDWARERGLLDATEEYSYERVVSRLQSRAHDVDEDVVFQYTTVDRYAPTGKISHEIRAFAREADAKMVFVGSTSAGGIVSSLQSVGSNVASDDAYDVVLVRRQEPLVD